MYTGQSVENVDESSKMNALVKRLIKNYLNKEHNLYMDNFYNSVGLAEELLKFKTHCTGTLRSNRIGNPKWKVSQKLEKEEQIWRKNFAGVYVFKWRNKQDVFSLTTGHCIEIGDIPNRFGVICKKPINIAKYNDYMSGIDCADQLMGY